MLKTQMGATIAVQYSSQLCSGAAFFIHQVEYRSRCSRFRGRKIRSTGCSRGSAAATIYQHKENKKIKINRKIERDIERERKERVRVVERKVQLKEERETEREKERKREVLGIGVLLRVFCEV
ncbi:hypothetical protein RJT34_03033 [Clitoria ternatea]|uniref:Uncharacterized protein n=1 Tax=Clitoria ternatea TaxID=43366 RepID=A0AAN9Q249_CLITE